MSVLAATAVLLLGGIYPDNHWYHSVKLNSENMDATIEESIAEGRTLFVRFIASEG